MIESNFAITATFITYLIGMLAIGYLAYKRTASSADYFWVVVHWGRGLRLCQQVPQT